MKAKTLLYLVLVTSTLICVFEIGPVGAQSTTIGVEPVKKLDPNLVAGSNSSVEIWVRNVAGLGGIEFFFGWNTSILTVTNVTYGGIFGSTHFPLGITINDTGGWLSYGDMEGIGEPGFSGDGRACIINFTVDATGECALDLYNTELGTAVVPPVPISHTVIDGYFSTLHIFLHSEGGPIDLSNPESTDWHALCPGYSNRYNITDWVDNDASSNLTVADDIKLKNKTSGSSKWYVLDVVTVTINATYLETRPVTTPISPSSNSGGWTNPTGAYADGGTNASITSGTPSASQVYGGYGFSFPNATITQVRVRYDAATPGSAALMTLLPNAAGTYPENISTVFPAAYTHYAACALNDDDASYVEESSTWERDLYSLQNAPGGQTGTINSVTVHMRVRGTKTSTQTSAQTSIMTGTFVYDGTEETVTTSYSDFSTTYAVNPANSQPWTWSQVNALEAGIRIQKNAGGAKTRCTYVWVVVDYVGYDEQIRVDVSWDGGTSWSAKQATSLTFSETTYWYDVTGATGWTPAKLTDANFRTRVDAYSVGTAGEVRLDWIPVNVSYTYPFSGQNIIEFGPRGQIQDFNWSNPVSTQWHEILPVAQIAYFKLDLTGWTDTDTSGNLTVGDAFTMTSLYNGFVRSCQVVGLSTDIVVKEIPPVVPEFPLGTVLPIALIVAVVYVWWINKRKRTTKQQKPTTTIISHSH